MKAAGVAPGVSSSRRVQGLTLQLQPIPTDLHTACCLPACLCRRLFNFLVRNHWDNVARLRQLTTLPTLFLSSLAVRGGRGAAAGAKGPGASCGLWRAWALRCNSGTNTDLQVAASAILPPRPCAEATPLPPAPLRPCRTRCCRPRR